MLEQAGSESQFDASSVRLDAYRLLDQLLLERRAAEQRLAESGRCDVIKSIAGRNSLEHAIEQTRQMIRNMDLLMDERRADVRFNPSPDEEPALMGMGAGHRS